MQNNLDTIHRYLRNEMSEEERADFEKEAEGNAEIQEAIVLHKRIEKAFEIEMLRETLRQVEQKYRPSQPPAPEASVDTFAIKQNRTGIIVAIMTGLFTLVLLAFWWFFAGKEQTSPRPSPTLYADSMLPHLNTNTLGGTDELAKAYEAKDEEALIAFFNQSPDYEHGKYLLMVYFETGQYAKLENFYQSHKDSPEVKLVAFTNYCLAAAALKQNDLATAKAYLEKTVILRSVKSKDAEEDLEKLGF